ncbi:MAG: peptidylprolyl isomerase [Gemmatales bacterium]|nr:MAG: peptidylprolyl isomerase [Gemmatales bacterium]
MRRPWHKRLGKSHRFGLVILALVLIGLTTYFCQSAPLMPRIRPAQKPAEKDTSAKQETIDDYQRRAVAYINETEVITRQDLGEYLIARQGPEKLPLLINKRIIDSVCQRHGISVSSAEVEAALAQDLRELNMTLKQFVETMLKQYRRTLEEWKEDVIRPRLAMTKLVKPDIRVSESDIRKTFESLFGEKVECRMILFGDHVPNDVYEKIRSSEEEFDRAAREQKSAELAKKAGKIPPIRRHALGDELEREAFQLKPGQVSRVIQTPDGKAVLKCDRRIPADTSKSLEAMRPKLIERIIEQKIHEAIPKRFAEIKKQARPRILLKPYKNRAEWLADIKDVDFANKPVAVIFDNIVITRRELGEYLIQRYGADKLPFLVNHRIIEHFCKKHNIRITQDEIDDKLESDVKELSITVADFEKRLLKETGKTLFEWKEDVIWPQLALTRMCKGEIKVTEEDIKKAFEAHYGKKVKGRLILFPHNEHHIAMKIWPKVRNSEEEFKAAARSQASPTLAAKGGDVRPISRYSTGNDELEREVLSLKEGEVSAIIGTPEGKVIFKCDRIIPPARNVKLEAVREQLEKEVYQKKLQAQIPIHFQKLYAQAAPKLFLTNQITQAQLMREVEEDLRQTGALAPPVKRK